MNLGDLRKIAVRQQTRIRFPLSGGMECVVNENGVAQVPALKGVPSFNLEQELASAQHFQLDSVVKDPKKPAATRSLSRQELAAMTGPSPAAEADDHDDE